MGRDPRVGWCQTRDRVGGKATEGLRSPVASRAEARTLDPRREPAATRKNLPADSLGSATTLSKCCRDLNSPPLPSHASRCNFPPNTQAPAPTTVTEPAEDPSETAAPAPEPAPVAPASEDRGTADEKPPAAAAPDMQTIMRKAQAIADKAVAEHAAGAGGTTGGGASDFSREDEDTKKRSRSRSRERSQDANDATLLPPRAFAAVGASVGAAAGAPITIEGTGGHEGRIIGRGGSTIKDLQSRFQVNIQIKRPEGITEITGVGANECAAEIRRIIEEAKTLTAGGGGGGGGGGPQFNADPNSVTETIMCEGAEGRIIGKGGQHIRAIMERTVRNFPTHHVPPLRLPILVPRRAHYLCPYSSCEGTVIAPDCLRIPIPDIHMVRPTDTFGFIVPGRQGQGVQRPARLRNHRRAARGRGRSSDRQRPDRRPRRGGARCGVDAAARWRSRRRRRGRGVRAPGGRRRRVRRVPAAAAATVRRVPAATATASGVRGLPSATAAATVRGYPPQQVQAPAGPALTGASGLPHAWQELASEGQVYYWNTETGATQYERPM